MSVSRTRSRLDPGDERSTRDQEAAASWNSLKRRTVAPSAAAARAVADTFRATWRRIMLVVGRPKTKPAPCARTESGTSGAQ